MINIREYIGKEKELTADQVRKLEPGKRIKLHKFDRRGIHEVLPMTVVREGKKKALSAFDYYTGDRIHKPIRKETERFCYTEVIE